MSDFENLIEKLNKPNESKNPLLLSFDTKTLCSLSQCSKKLRILTSSEELWKTICISQWNELIGISLNSDPFPAWKSCYGRKVKEGDTKLEDLMREFKDCDWYSCPNGHLYLIGECRLPMFRAKCATCGLPIGGRDHKMLSTNKRLGSVWNPEYSDINVERIEKTFNTINNWKPIRVDIVDDQENETSSSKQIIKKKESIQESDSTTDANTPTQTSNSSSSNNTTSSYSSNPISGSPHSASISTNQSNPFSTPVRTGPLTFETPKSDSLVEHRIPAEEATGKRSKSAVFETPTRTPPSYIDFRKSPPDFFDEDPSEGSSDEHTSSTTVSVEGEDDPFRFEVRLREEFQVKKEHALRELFRTMGSSSNSTTSTPPRGYYDSFSRTPTRGVYDSYSNTTTENAEENFSDLDGESLAEFPSDDELIGL